MRKIIYNMFIIVMLLICSISLTSCNAITAQKITIPSSNPGMNGGGGMKGGQGMHGGPDMNGGPGMDGNMRDKK